MLEWQKGFVFLPGKALDFFETHHCHPTVILIDEEPVGFFVLHRSEETHDFTVNDHAVFLRAFSIDKDHQGKGYATMAMNNLPEFVRVHLPQVEEIVLTVNENNSAAKRSHEKSGFIHKGKTKVGRSGIELGMHYSLHG